MQLRVSIHQEMMNKEVKPSQGWSPQLFELKSLMKWVEAGHGWCATHFVNRHRLAENARGSNVVVVDIDGDTTLDHFWNAPTALNWCAATYTSCSHTEESHRFRALFPLGLELQSIAQHKAAYHFIVDRLLADLGIERLKDNCGEKPERLWYGNTNALTLFNQEDSYEPVPAFILENVEAENDSIEFIKSDITDIDLKRCKWLLENFIYPTEDGEYAEGNLPNRSGFVQVTAACAGIGECIFEDWVNWVNRGHHGEKDSNTKAEKWKNLGDYGGHKCLYGIAKKQDPYWQHKLPVGLKFRAEGSAIGYSQCDPEPVFTTTDNSVQTSVPTDNSVHISTNTDTSPKPMDFTDNTEPTPDVELAPKRRGRPKKTASDAAAERDQDVETIKALLPNLGKNLLTSQLEYTGNGGQRCALQGNDIEIMTTKFAVEHGVFIPEARCKTAVLYTASMNTFCPIKQYLDKCAATAVPHPDWETCGKEFLGNEKKLATMIMQRMMIGAVARAYDPGCSMSWIPILVGAQGVGKSMFSRNLCPPELFAEVTTPLEILMKEQYRLHTAWLLELPEIDNYFSVKNIENFKNLITTRVDETRKPYAMLPEKLRRRFIMIGTTNRNQFLVDSTGNRRFIPLEIPSDFLIPFERLAAERDQLWAAAIQAYRSHARYEFHSAEINQINDYIQEFGDPDPWSDIIREWVSQKKETTSVEVLTKALNLDSKQQDRRSARRVGDVLSTLGWRRLNTTRWQNVETGKWYESKKAVEKVDKTLLEKDDKGYAPVQPKSVRLWQRPKNQPISENHILHSF